MCGSSTLEGKEVCAIAAGSSHVLALSGTPLLSSFDVRMYVCMRVIDRPRVVVVCKWQSAERWSNGESIEVSPDTMSSARSCARWAIALWRASMPRVTSPTRSQVRKGSKLADAFGRVDGMYCALPGVQWKSVVSGLVMEQVGIFLGPWVDVRVHRWWALTRAYLCV